MTTFPITQSVLNDAQVSGAAIAKDLADKFEQQNRSPSPEQISAFEREAATYFDGLSCPWTNSEITEAWRLAMTYTVMGRVKVWRRPMHSGGPALNSAEVQPLLASQRSWSQSFGIRR